MDGMSMGGMDMSSTGLFVGVNKTIAHALWYIVAAVVATQGFRRLIDMSRNYHAKRKYKSLRSAVPSRPTNAISQSYDTILAVFRESTYPMLQPLKGRVFRYFSLPPLGHCLLLLTYWTIILIMLWTNVFLSPSSNLYGYKWEKPAFRAAWVSVTQVPLIYALSSKFSIISIITGISYERLNWLHRWVSRTLFLTVIVHWAYFFHEWTLADFVKYQFQVMPMVKYGFGAWAVIGWTVLTGFGLFRDLCYELWVLQHLASAGVLLWLVYVHVPSYARYNVWLAIGFVAFDRGARGVWSLLNNTHRFGIFRGKGLGFRGQAEALEHGYLRLTLKDTGFGWKAGQHVFLSMPTCGIFESHPFTIASTAPSTTTKASTTDLELYMKCHSGFTKRLQRRAQKSPATIHRVFLSGPWGIPPLTNIERADSLIFVASSTGASFTVPLLEHAIRKAPYVQRLCFYWIIRHEDQVEWFKPRLQAAIEGLAPLGLESVTFKIFVTSTPNLTVKSLTSSSSSNSLSVDLPTQGKASQQHDSAIKVESTSNISTSSSTSSQQNSSFVAADSIDKHQLQQSEKSVSSTISATTPTLDTYRGRPASFDSLIRPTVETSTGETFVVACGGKSLMAQVRTYVAQLSDERAVHKGTGAQGIGLFTETYGW
ncbi:ferric-chelate reductase Frp1 [Neophaeococcomyces mojaviensis]|uniref:Ferric-chelate reductase Frp1 n=1 Tax=Neophaeococcomyces mojaviensis TaxID=3383035 RepID=A0ACC3A7T4_9EURO|nr:ferric-chelate reductase Frp1 [Knufia sp. JES_112]